MFFEQKCNVHTFEHTRSRGQALRLAGRFSLPVRSRDTYGITGSINLELDSIEIVAAL